MRCLHSAQYIWITSYYQRREARAEGQKTWHVAAYFVTLLAGGIALFIPGPWLVSYLFHYDFTTSFLIFVSLVNIHHFILDAKLWKLRDKRVAALLVEQSGKPSGPAADASSRPASNARALVVRVLSAPAFRISLAALLFLWGGFDQFHFALRTAEGNLPALLRASQINPYDSFVEERIARAETQQGQQDQAVAALSRAVAINPSSITLQQAAARAMIADGRYADAYAHYQKMLERFPRDADALTNYGLLAARLGHPEEAMDSWQKSVDINPNQPNAHLYLAEAFDQRGEPAAAARHWNSFLQLVAANPQSSPGAPAFTQQQILAATVQFADDETRINQSAAALTQYDLAIAQARAARRRETGKPGAGSSRGFAKRKMATPQRPRNPTNAAWHWMPRAATRTLRHWTGSITDSFCGDKMRRTNGLRLLPACRRFIERRVRLRAGHRAKRSTPAGKQDGRKSGWRAQKQICRRKSGAPPNFVPASR